jgi:hypothetical protein
MPLILMEALNSLAMNRGPLSLMMRGVAAGYRSVPAFKNALDITLLHRLANIPMDKRTTETI